MYHQRNDSVGRMSRCPILPAAAHLGTHRSFRSYLQPLSVLGVSLTLVRCHSNNQNIVMYLPIYIALTKPFSFVLPCKNAVEISAAHTSRLFNAANTNATRIVSMDTTPEYASSLVISGAL